MSKITTISKPMGLKFIFLCFSFFFLGSLQSQSIYTVNTVDDLDDGVCDSSHCSLREAINASNSDGIDSEVNFNLTGSAPFYIPLDITFPEIIYKITIDASTQAGFYPGIIIVDGQNDANYFNTQSSSGGNDMNVYGLSFENFRVAGLKINNGIIGEEGKGNIFIQNEQYGLVIDGNKTSKIIDNKFGIDQNGTILQNPVVNIKLKMMLTV